MNYILTWYSESPSWSIDKNYYISHDAKKDCTEVCSTNNASKATVFKSAQKAKQLARILNMQSFMGHMKIEEYTNKELFITGLKG